MADKLIEIAPGFWNIRGSFKIAGVVDIGTQASLVRRADGRFILLDSYDADEAVTRQILDLTDGGAAIHAILNLHPFHTVHVKAAHARFPHAELYGTSRHQARQPDLAWQPHTTDGPELHALFADDLVFSVPDGVDFISDNDNVHFSSVLAFHPASRTLHVDDTLSFFKIPLVDKLSGKPGHLSFHPTLGKALKPQPGAAAAFEAWALDLAQRCSQIDTVCTAHVGVLRVGEGPSIESRVRAALDKVRGTLKKHSARWG